MKHDYIIASVAVTDEIYFQNGEHKYPLAGGAGIYALAGIKIWNNSVELVTGVGKDYQELYGAWYQKNHISMNGVIIKDEKTPHTIIYYQKDGERKEVPVYGDEHFLKIEVTPAELKPYFQTAKGIYIFKNANKDFWAEILRYHEDSKAKIMWEIADDDTRLEKLKEVRQIAKRIDVFSINKREAFELLHVNTVEEAIEEFKTWNVPLIFFRQGKKGAYMITKEGAVLAESLKEGNVVDSTGGGNSSSGAVLYAFCENIEPRIAGLMGSISAAICLEQYGVPVELNEETRKRARAMLAKIV